MSGDRVVFTATLGELAEVPGSPYAYWAPPSLRKLFQKYPPLDRDVAWLPDKEKIADVKVGLQTSDDFRFTRYWWEIPVDQIAVSREETCQGKKWVPFAKGGRPFFHDITVVVNWENEGSEIKNFRNNRGRQLSRPQNESFYFYEGLTWTKSGWISSELYPRLDIGILPKGAIFTAKRMAIFIQNAYSTLNKYLLCAFLRSILAVSIIHLINPTGRNREAGQIAQIPLSKVIYESNLILSDLAHEAYDLLCEWDTGNEASTQFITPLLLQVWRGFSPSLKPASGHPLACDFTWSDWPAAKEARGEGPGPWEGPVSLRAMAEEVVRRETILRRRLDEIQSQIDDEVYRLYEISAEDRRLIEAELAETATADEAEKQEDLDGNSGESTEAANLITLSVTEHILRLLHYAAHQVLKSDSEGIVPLYRLYFSDGSYKEGLVEQVRQFLAHEFGQEHLAALEEEINSVLGKSLADWLAEDLFSYHLSLYRLRPVIWLITSQNFSQGSRPRGYNRQGAFNCFFYWHRLTSDTLYRIQHIYLRPLLEAARREKERLQLEVAQAKDLPVRQRRLKEQEYQAALDRLEELAGFDQALESLLRPQDTSLAVASRSDWVKEKVKEISDQGYRPNLDYGVRVNLEPLKQYNLLPREASRVRG